MQVGHTMGLGHSGIGAWPLYARGKPAPGNVTTPDTEESDQEYSDNAFDALDRLVSRKGSQAHSLGGEGCGQWLARGKAGRMSCVRRLGS